MSLMEARHAAVRDSIAELRRIEAEEGVTRAALEQATRVLVDLARREELFPQSHFPVADERAAGRIYRLSEDADHRFALYATAGLPGRSAPPHNHTTWAVIAGVRGAEHNVFYERTDDRSVPGEGTLRRTGELTVERGNAVAFLPDDFHTIEFRGKEPALHLHCYGIGLEHLPERIAFATASGGAYRVFPPNSGIAVAELPPAELKTMIGDGEELAILDVREEGPFSRGHLLFAASLPLSHLELRVAALVPRRGARIVVVDGDGGALAQRAASRLFGLGYTNIAVLAGGVEGWRRAGYEVFTGVFVPSKAFGEFVEHRYGTPRIRPDELKARLDAGASVLILDSRPREEFERMSIPGGIDCPGAELVYRVHDFAPSPETLVVVNCAGRTRSIIGAQSLINAGLPNKIVALENGTMGWHLAGLALAHGETRSAPPPTAPGLERARAAAERVAVRFGVERIDRATLGRFASESDRRSLFLLDVRSPEEYAAGHLPGARCAPGGQLVQSTDLYVGTRNARLVLVDTDGVRATMTASWLRQMGWRDAFVLADDLAGEAQETGAEKPRTLDPPQGTPTIDVPALAARLAEGTAIVVDLASSLEYRAAHIPGAWFAIRSRLGDALTKLPPAGALVFTSPDGLLALYAARDAAALSDRAVLALAGGTASWRAAGFDLDAGEERLADATDDVWYKPYDHPGGVEAAMRDYLRWEVALVEQIARDGDARFEAFARD